MRNFTLAEQDMTAINSIVSKLQKYPEINYEIDNDTINIQPTTDDGFLVWLTETDHGLTVGFEGWHAHLQLEEEEDALNLFALGLNEDCRLKVSRKGTSEYKWTPEMKDENGWSHIGTIWLLFFPFWKKNRDKYFTNTYIKTNS